MLSEKKYNEKEIKKLSKIANEILNLEKEISKLSDEEIRKKTLYFKRIVENGKKLDELLIEVFAIAREATFRVLKKKQYKVQLIGGIAIHQGRIAEMKTGEGKTLTEICPAYLNSLENKGVHILTVNDYLAERDMNEMKPVFEFLGLTTDIIRENSTRDERKIAYKADITYTTNTEIGFDYLKDHMTFENQDIVQRSLNFAILDEADSILIDEARTPLIISENDGDSVCEYEKFDLFIRKLKSDDYEKDEEDNSILLSKTGVEKAEKYFGFKNIASLENSNANHHINQALRAHKMMIKDKDYIVKNSEVVIIDQFTGRMAEGRRFSDGLHQAIEAKENLEIKAESKTLATITYQNLFKLYKKLSGMSGTCKTEEIEIKDVYGLDVIEVPMNKQLKRIDRDDKVFATKEEKLKVIVEDVKKINKLGNPILVCTQTIEKSEELAKIFEENNIKFKLLNAKYIEEEANIVSLAGKKNCITIATNMAGRGTNIKISEEINRLGGLKVIGCERAYSRRVDNQLIGRAGRQGAAGESQFYISLEDDLLKTYGVNDLEKLLNKRNLLGNCCTNTNKINKYIKKAQKKIEGIHYEERKSTVKFDSVINEQRKIIYKQRQSIVNGEKIEPFINGMLQDNLENVVMVLLEKNNLDESVFEEDFNCKKKICIDIFDELMRNYIGLEQEVILFDQMYEQESVEELISFLKEGLFIIVKDRINSLEAEFDNLEKIIILPIIDELWMNHIDKMTALKKDVSMVSFKQQDPFQIYKIEGIKLFEELIKEIRVKYIKKLFEISNTVMLKN